MLIQAIQPPAPTAPPASDAIAPATSDAIAPAASDAIAPPASDAVEIVDKVAAQLGEIAQKCASAFLGYGKADLLDLNPKWRIWNKRQVVRAQVEKLEDSMRRRGIQRYLPGHRIPILVPRDWVVVEALTQTTGTGDDTMPMIKWTDRADLQDIAGASGQHRFQALINIKTSMQKEIEKLEKTLAAMAKGSVEDDGSELAAVDLELRQKKIELASVGMWGFVLYDRGIVLLNRLSWNCIDFVTRYCFAQ